MMLHHHIHNRLLIEGYLTLKTAVHIGGSNNEGRGLSQVIKDMFDRPFLPGSSFKGSFRSRVESMAHLVVPERTVCHQVKDDSHACLSAQKSGIRDMQFKIKAIAKDPGKAAMADAEIGALIEAGLCPACQLFGGASWRSKLTFDDLHPLAEMNFPIEHRDGVGIDRDTRQAAKSAKYEFEAVPAGAQFAFKMMGENLSPQDLGLLAVGMLDLLDGHFSLGGKTSRGLGEVVLQEPKVQFWDTDDAAQKRKLLLRQPSPIKGEPRDWFVEQLENKLTAI